MTTNLRKKINLSNYYCQILSVCMNIKCVSHLYQFATLRQILSVDMHTNNSYSLFQISEKCIAHVPEYGTLA